MNKWDVLNNLIEKKQDASNRLGFWQSKKDRGGGSVLDGEAHLAASKEEIKVLDEEIKKIRELKD